MPKSKKTRRASPEPRPQPNHWVSFHSERVDEAHSSFRDLPFAASSEVFGSYMTSGAASSSSGPAVSLSPPPDPAAPGPYSQQHRAAGLRSHRDMAVTAVGFDPQRHTAMIHGRPVQVRTSCAWVLAASVWSASFVLQWAAMYGTHSCQQALRSYAVFLTSSKARLHSPCSSWPDLGADPREGERRGDRALCPGPLRAGARGELVRQECRLGATLPQEPCGLLWLEGTSFMENQLCVPEVSVVTRAPCASHSTQVSKVVMSLHLFLRGSPHSSLPSFL